MDGATPEGKDEGRVEPWHHVKNMGLSSFVSRLSFGRQMVASCSATTLVCALPRSMMPRARWRMPGKCFASWLNGPVWNSRIVRRLRHTGLLLPGARVFVSAKDTLLRFGATWQKFERLLAAPRPKSVRRVLALDGRHFTIGKKMYLHRSSGSVLGGVRSRTMTFTLND